MSRKDGPDIVPNMCLNRSRLVRVKDKFHYLGHIVTESLSDHVDFERERRAFATRVNMFARRFARCSEQVKITLFKAYCQTLQIHFKYVIHVVFGLIMLSKRTLPPAFYIIIFSELRLNCQDIVMRQYYFH